MPATKVTSNHPFAQVKEPVAPRRQASSGVRVGIPEAWLVSLLRSLDQRRLAQLGNGHALRLPATLLGQASW